MAFHLLVTSKVYFNNTGNKKQSYLFIDLLEGVPGFRSAFKAFASSEASLQFVENEWNRPSVKRGWGIRSSRHCKERLGVGGGSFKQ